ncbi:MAG TPA: tetraacyldisaccharide 4'-kinase [Terriglobia bacterium]|nr:tetraacyldisaccharide 4'-kinase [Terriglobia bacterium]
MNVLLEGLSRICLTGVKLRDMIYRRGWLKTRRLTRPVISVGNLSVGGTGKTPMVILMAKTLLAAGHRPCILTRGYRRRGGKGPIVLDPDAGLIFDPRKVGDEPAALARALPNVPIIVYGDRFRAGKIGERDFRATVHLLDDGFQHLALHRDLDVVLLDVTRLSSDLAVLPAGRLREPFSALQRAHWVMLTRTELGDVGELQARVQAVNPLARIFRCSTKFAGLVEARSRLAEPLENLLPRKVWAFCGVGNPDAFFADLRSWGFRVAGEGVFPDHHAYGRPDLDNISALSRSAGAEAILTTEKDLMNLPANWNAPVPLFACCIETEVEERMEFEQALLTEVESAAAQRAT